MEELAVSPASARIQVLPEDVASRIAAGEVVERPASVLKELLENSLDAGASKIEVEVHGAGRRSILVVDDGAGMEREDCRLAFGRHATSKLRSIEDLDDLSTMGFRGEALYAIGAVSEVSLNSGRDGKAWRVEVVGGKVTAESEAPPIQGTRIEVRNLFFNTPARLKFMKSDGVERSRITRVVEEVALARPGLSITLRLEGKLALRAGPVEGEGALETRVGETLGIEVTEGLIPVQAQRPEASVRGLISASDRLIGNRNLQYLFVNGRPVASRVLQQALYKAYDGRDSKKHPVAVLFVDLPSDAVDVNVHPQKAEVRFRDEGKLWELLAVGLGQALAAAQNPAPLAPDAPPPARLLRRGPTKTLLNYPGVQQARDTAAVYKAVVDGPAAAPAPAPSGADAPVPPLRIPAPPARETPAPTRGEQGEFEPARGEKDPAWWTPPFRFLGQLEKSYLVFEAHGGLLLVDQHAAAERVAYERYMEQTRRGPAACQRLILPLEVELPASQFQALLGLKDFLAEAGFETEPFGERTLLTHSLPDMFPMNGETLRELYERLSETPDLADAAPETLHERLATLACKGAVKAHESLQERAALQLLEDLRGCQAPQCPHGRPALLSMDRGELARRFKRPGPPPLD